MELLLRVSDHTALRELTQPLPKHTQINLEMWYFSELIQDKQLNDTKSQNSDQRKT